MASPASPRWQVPICSPTKPRTSKVNDKMRFAGQGAVERTGVVWGHIALWRHHPIRPLGKRGDTTVEPCPQAKDKRDSGKDEARTRRNHQPSMQQQKHRHRLVCTCSINSSSTFPPSFAKSALRHLSVAVPACLQRPQTLGSVSQLLESLGIRE